MSRRDLSCADVRLPRANRLFPPLLARMPLSVCFTRAPSWTADAPGHVRQLSRVGRPLERNQDTTRRPQRTDADLSRRLSPPRQKQLAHKERVKIAIQTNAELGRLQTEAMEAAFPATGSDLEQQRQAIQQLADDYQLIVTERGSYMDAINMATLLHHLSAAVHHVQSNSALSTVVHWQRVVGEVVQLAHHRVREFKLPEVHMSIWALAKLGCPLHDLPAGFLEDMANRAMQRLRELPAVSMMNLTNLLWAYARLGHSPLQGELFHVGMAIAVPRADEMSPQNICNIVWAAVVLGEASHLPSSTWEEMAKICMLKMPEMPIQSVSNLMWAYAKMGLSPLQGDFLRVACNRVSELHTDVSPLQASVILWSLGTLRHSPAPRLLDRLALSFWQHLGPATPTQHLSMVLWSLARMKQSPLNGKVARDITTQALLRVRELNEQELANILWSVAVLRIKCPMEQHAERFDTEHARASLALWQSSRQDRAELQHMANSVWGYAQLRLDPLGGRLFAWAMQAVLQQLKHSARGHLHHLASLVLSHGIMQHPIDNADVSTLLHIFCRDAGMSHGQEMCNMLWGLAALRQLHVADLHRITDRITELNMELNVLELRQLQQADMLVRARQGHDLTSAQSYLSPKLVSLVYQVRHQVNQFALSRFHEEVAQLLAHMGIPHQLEVTSKDGLFCFDIVAENLGEKVVIEVDGRSHFSALPPHRALGGTYIRNTLFAAFGHKGIAIAYFQWERLASLEARQKYVQRKLAACARDISQ